MCWVKDMWRSNLLPTPEHDTSNADPGREKHETRCTEMFGKLWLNTKTRSQKPKRQSFPKFPKVSQQTPIFPNQHTTHKNACGGAYAATPLSGEYTMAMLCSLPEYLAPSITISTVRDPANACRVFCKYTLHRLRAMFTVFRSSTAAVSSAMPDKACRASKQRLRHGVVYMFAMKKPMPMQSITCGEATLPTPANTNGEAILSTSARICGEAATTRTEHSQ